MFCDSSYPFGWISIHKKITIVWTSFHYNKYSSNLRCLCAFQRCYQALIEVFFSSLAHNMWLKCCAFDEIFFQFPSVFTMFSFFPQYIWCSSWVRIDNWSWHNIKWQQWWTSKCVFPFTWSLATSIALNAINSLLLSYSISQEKKWGKIVLNVNHLHCGQLSIEFTILQKLANLSNMSISIIWRRKTKCETKTLNSATTTVAMVNDFCDLIIDIIWASANLLCKIGTIPNVLFIKSVLEVVRAFFVESYRE